MLCYVMSRDIKGRPRSRAVRLRIFLAFHITITFITPRILGCTRGYVTSRYQGLFPPHPFFKGKALGTRLRGRPILLITRIGLHSVLLPVNHNFNKICDIIGYFLNQNTRNSKFCFASSEKKGI